MCGINGFIQSGLILRKITRGTSCAIVAHIKITTTTQRYSCVHMIDKKTVHKVTFFLVQWDSPMSYFSHLRHQHGLASMRMVRV